MKPTIMFTALGRPSWLLSMRFLSLLALLALFGCGSDQKQKEEHNATLKAHQLAPQNNQAIFFVPNSYLERLVAELVRTKAGELYDQSLYQIESFTHQRSSATAKVFKLSLVKSQGFKALSSQKSKTAQMNAINAIYSPQNLLDIEVTVNKTKDGVSITSKNPSGQQLVLFQQKLDKLSALLKDSLLTIEQEQLKNISFYGTGVIINFSDRNQTAIDEIVRHLDANYGFQHIGVSVILPFGFISSVTNGSKIYFQTDNASFKGTYLTGMAIRNGANNQILGSFKLNNDDNPLFREVISGECALEPTRNRVLSMGNFSYKADNLSATERAQMDLLVKICRDSIAAKLINHSLAPTFNKARLSFSAEGQQLSKRVYSSTISYFKDYMIYKINLRND